jgi:RHS repeat-associated protein
VPGWLILARAGTVLTAEGVCYVRDYLNGSTANSGNHWVEIEVWGTRTVVYVGSHYEKDLTSGQVTKYYYFAGQRVAMNKGGVVYYLVTDHLGSASLALDSSGAKVSEMRYRAYGEMRYSGPPTGTQTDYRFTGQRQLAGVGLYNMGARWYDAYLARWLSPDTLVPDPADMELNEDQAYHEPYSPYWDCYANPATPGCQVTPQQELETFAFVTTGLFTTGLGEIIFSDLAAIPAIQFIGARLFKSSAEEVAESQMTGRPVDPVNIALDAATEFLDEARMAASQEGAFSIFDWSGYPGSQRPKGPFRLLTGDEYSEARSLANEANRAIHAADPSLKGLSIHELQPVKFGGSPTDPANKIYLTPQEHAKYTSWWNNFQRGLTVQEDKSK